MARRYVLAFVFVWTPAAILAMAWGITYNWPDYLHVMYGYPLAWANHTIDTFVGPVDKWQIDMTALGIDLLFWFGLLAVGTFALLRWRRPGTTPTPP